MTRSSASRALAVLLALAGAATAAEPAPTLSQPPRLLKFVEAEAPPALATRGHAEVLLTIDVDATGKVERVTVATPAGDGFDEAAVAAARQFVFAPGEAAGKPVPVRITYKYKFFFKPAAPPAPTPVAPAPEAPAPTEPAQPPAQLAGQIKHKGDRVPVAGVTVIVDGGAFTAISDDDGRFRFDGIPPGAHTIKLRAAAILPADAKLQLTAGKRIEATYYVEARARYSATVRAQKAVVETVEQTLDASELKRIPGTQGDTLKAVQNLPGVARSPFGGGLLVVWGSAPGDTRTYVDGVFIPTLYHFGGLRSTVNSEIVQSLTFMPGGYGVDHGRGLGGVIEVQSRRPRRDGYHGFVQIDLIDGSLMIEGPIGKSVEFAVGARRSWIDALLPIFTTSDFQLSPVYYDYQARLHWRASSHDDVDLFAFGSDDAISVIAKRPDPRTSAAFDSHIYYHRVLASWLHRFGNKATFSLTPSIGYDVPFQANATIGNSQIAIDVETLEYNLRAVARVPLASFLRLDAGLDFEGNRFTISGTTPVSGMPREGDRPGRFFGGVTPDDITLYRHDVALYAAANFSLLHNRLLVTPQLRLDLFTATGYQGSPDAFAHAFFEVEPRLAARFQVNKWLAFKGAVGLYHQPPDPTSFLKNFGDPSVQPELALHYVLGLEVQPTPTLHIEMQGFYKDLRSLIVRGEQATDPKLQNDGIGRVYGGELLIRQELWKGLFGWIAYTISRSERQDHPDDPWRLFQFDQTHILTLVASYKFGRGYQVGVRFRYVTGNPYTPVPQGAAFYDANRDAYVPLYGAPYSARLAAFNQLDVRFDKTWTFNRWGLSLYIDLQNVYRADNPEGVSYNYNYTQTTPVTGLPFLPVLGLRGDF
jgi:TonB family protein